MTYPRVSPLGGKPDQVARAINRLLATSKVAEVPATDIANVGATVNVVGKYAGKLIWDTTNNRMMRAATGDAAGAWWVVDGSASVTPA